jgi:pimeloyl-ACP methyl ester carboxylesterase
MEQAVQGSARHGGFRYWFPRILLGLAILFLIPILIGSAWQFLTQRAEGRQVLPLGQLTNVDGHFIHIYCTGLGSPTVILEGGVPEWSIHWQKVQPEISKFTRVCSYDRAGYGWSETGPGPRTAERIVGELHALLRNSGEPGPFVYVAHSFWGPAALLYQRTHPDEIAVMVLIEAWSPELFTPAPDVITQSLPLAKTLKTVAPLGQLRLFGELGILPLGRMLKADLLPGDLRSAYKASYYDDRMWNAIYEEYSAMEESGRQTKDISSLGDLPLVVIKAGIRPPGDYPPDDIWDATQSHLAGLSSQGELIVDEKSGHLVQLENPALVVDAVRKVLEKGSQ